VVEVNLVLDTFVHFIPVWVIPPAEYRRYLGPGLYDGTWFIGTPCCGKFANGYRISFRDFHQHDGSPRNESIQSLFARPEQDIPHPWAGPVLFIKMKGFVAWLIVLGFLSKKLKKIKD
jgi:hypothetical protein